MMDEDKHIEQDIEVFDGQNEAVSAVSSKKEGNAKDLTLAVIHAVDALGQCSVLIDGADEPVPCIATFSLSASDVGRKVALMFVNADQSQPVAIGLIRSQLDRIIELQQASSGDEQEAVVQEASSKQLLVDGESIKIEGKEEIVLKCGDSSITLNKNGKITIRGKYLLNRSSGVNRIMGGSVQLN
ncbi:hypothetical protein TDB9533_03534 [Thalassocella blandensis]|nr:hypothetical protein TDB9533_03534 [Thalassocella blandensis]